MRKPQQPHEVLEQELETLTTAGGQDHVEDDEVRKRMRVIKNRLSAKKSREQARDYVQKLESSLSALVQQNHSMARRLAMAEHDNALLRQHMYFSQPNTPPQNHIDQPAVLSKSPQLDAVLALVWATMVMLIGLPHAPPKTHVLLLFKAKSTAQHTLSATPGWVRKLRRVLRRSGLLGWRDPLCSSTLLSPLLHLHQATAAA